MSLEKFLPGDKVFVRGSTDRPGWPTGLAKVCQKHDHHNWYSIIPEGTVSVHAWYPGESLTMISRKGVAFSMLPNAAHVKLKLQGTTKKVELFHYILAKLDPDWPWRPENDYKPSKYCGACAGAIYANPNFLADDIRILARQIDGMNRITGGLKVDIKKFNVQARCTKQEGDDKDPATEIETIEDKPVGEIIAGTVQRAQGNDGGNA